MQNSLLRNQEQSLSKMKLVVILSLCVACVCATFLVISKIQTSAMLSINTASFPIARGQLLWNLDTGIVGTLGFMVPCCYK